MLPGYPGFRASMADGIRTTLPDTCHIAFRSVSALLLCAPFGDQMRPGLTLARFVMLEARRTGLPLLAFVALGAGVGMAGFLSQLALTESSHLQAGILAAFFRVSVVFLTGTFVVTSMVRESSDKGLELLLSLPISRTTFYLGKLAGYAATGGILAAAFSLVMLVWSPPLSVTTWFVSLLLEVILVASVSLFFVVTLGQIVPALAAAAGTYFLGRVIAAVQAISTSPLNEDSVLQRMAGWGIDAVALLLPPLDRATQTVWLLYGPPSPGEFLALAGLLFVYGALVTAAGLFDFHRRNL